MRATPEVLSHSYPLLTVQEAKKDWWQAERFFEEVTDPDLVDLAIFWEQAARLRYIYLLRCLKEEGFVLTPREVIRQALR